MHKPVSSRSNVSKATEDSSAKAIQLLLKIWQTSSSFAGEYKAKESSLRVKNLSLKKVVGRIETLFSAPHSKSNSLSD